MGRAECSEAFLLLKGSINSSRSFKSKMLGLLLLGNWGAEFDVFLSIQPPADVPPHQLDRNSQGPARSKC